MMEYDGPIGFLLVDKEPASTSHDVVSRARRALGTRRVGHAGTLDPMATGLLVLGVGPATKLLHYLVGLDKEYLATILLGSSTVTDDADGEIVATAVAGWEPATGDAVILDAISKLKGDILQRPSSVSAIKVAGRRAYEMVRSGDRVDLPERPVRVSEFEVLQTRRTDDAIELDVRIRCSSGTYVRALARDLGEALGVGGHLTSLRRTRVGPLDCAEAVQIPVLDRSSASDSALLDAMLSPEDVVARLFPVLRLDAAQTLALKDGKRIAVAALDATPVAAFDENGRLIGLVEVSKGVARVLMNLPTAIGPTGDSGRS